MASGSRPARAPRSASERQQPVLLLPGRLDAALAGFLVVGEPSCAHLDRRHHIASRHAGDADAKNRLHGRHGRSRAGAPRRGRHRAARVRTTGRCRRWRAPTDGCWCRQRAKVFRPARSLRCGHSHERRAQRTEICAARCGARGRAAGAVPRGRVGRRSEGALREASRSFAARRRDRGARRRARPRARRRRRGADRRAAVRPRQCRRLRAARRRHGRRDRRGAAPARRSTPKCSPAATRRSSPSRPAPRPRSRPAAWCRAAPTPWR